MNGEDRQSGIPQRIEPPLGGAARETPSSDEEEVEEGFFTDDESATVTRTSATGDPAAHQRPDHAEAVERCELLAFLGRARAIVHRNLEDPLAVLNEPGGDLRLDREPSRLQRQAPEDVGPDHLVAGHDVVQVDVEENVARQRDALVSEDE